MQSIQNKRIDYIEFLQSFAVVLVVIGHTVPKPSFGDTESLLWRFASDVINTFHMPLFFTLAGFLLMNSFYKNSKGIQNFCTFISSKVKRIIIPYFAIGTLAYLLKIFVFNSFAYRPAELGVTAYLKSMLIPWDNPDRYLWFLPTIFLCFLISYLVLCNENYKKVNIWIFVILSFLVSFTARYLHIAWLNISGALYYLFYFFVGALIFNKKEKLFQIFSNNVFIVFMIILFLELQLLPLFHLNCMNYIRYYLMALSGIFISFSLAIYCSKYNYKFFWGLIDGQYYQIYLLSWFFQCGMRVFYQIHLTNYMVTSLLMFISSFIFPILITNIIKKYIPKIRIFIGL